ncbi:MAG TPA: formylglycine-generating enzyme family protein, partial [Polyangiaceae bacterium]|nr:formylglycine-generating enzyme family protein [Polyangiaceae bacterium]
MSNTGSTNGIGSGNASGADSVSGSGTSSSSQEAGAVAPSCAAGGLGMTNCGTAQESCCTSLEVTGGTYNRTYANLGAGPTGEADPATVSNFRLDKYDVTVGRFRQFVTAWNGGWMPAAGSGKHTHLNGGMGLVNALSPSTYESGWIAADDTKIAPTNANLVVASDQAAFATWTDAVGMNENLPLNNANWYEAYAFCIWDGGFLPSESEWEYAAAGGNQEREYPWGSTGPGIQGEYAIYNCYYPNAGSCTGRSNIAPVGHTTRGAGLWGQLDLAGNMWQWNLDWYASYVDPCTDCADLTASTNRVVRGGNFGNDQAYLLP